MPLRADVAANQFDEAGARAFFEQWEGVDYGYQVQHQHGCTPHLSTPPEPKSSAPRKKATLPPLSSLAELSLYLTLYLSVLSVCLTY